LANRTIERSRNPDSPAGLVVRSHKIVIPDVAEAATRIAMIEIATLAVSGEAIDAQIETKIAARQKARSVVGN
jgi:hypothetical protein